MGQITPRKTILAGGDDGKGGGQDACREGKASHKENGGANGL